MAETDFLRRSLNNPRFNTFTASGFAGSGGGGGSTTSEDDLKQAVMAIQPGGRARPWPMSASAMAARRKSHPIPGRQVTWAN